MAGAETRQHSSVKRYRELARLPATGTLDRELLLDGVHLLLEAHNSQVDIETAAFDYLALERPDVRELAENLSRSGAEVLIVSRKVLEAMSPVKTPSGAVGIARRSLLPLKAVLTRRPPVLVVLACDVQDPGNVGAMMRAAEAAGATGFVACGSSADPLGWKALRGSMGSALRLPIARSTVDEALDGCLAAKVEVVALTAHRGTPFFAHDFRPGTALLLGSEGTGLAPAVAARATHLVAIPMTTPVESLNVAVAAALVTYEAFRQRTA